MSTHFQRLCLAIDDLHSEINFDVPPLPPDSGFLQELESYPFTGSFAGLINPREDDDSLLGIGVTTTPGISFIQQMAQKRRKGNTAKYGSFNIV